MGFEKVIEAQCDVCGLSDTSKIGSDGGALFAFSIKRFIGASWNYYEGEDRAELLWATWDGKEDPPCICAECSNRLNKTLIAEQIAIRAESPHWEKGGGDDN